MYKTNGVFIDGSKGGPTRLNHLNNVLMDGYTYSRSLEDIYGRFMLFMTLPVAPPAGQNVLSFTEILDY